MSLKDLIAAAFNKDATAFESAFGAVMQDKVAAGLQSRFSAVAEEAELEEAKKSEKDDEEDDKEDDDEDEMCEDVDQIDELSKKTLGSYVKKASNDLTHIQRNISSPSSGVYDKDRLSDIRANRKQGIHRAVDKLTK